MAHQKVFIFLLIFGTVHSASIIETSYEYVMNLGKNLAPSFMSILDCFGEQDAWVCAKEKAGIIFDGWDKEVDKQRRMWREEADAEVRSSGRSLEEMPSVLGKEIEEGLGSLSDLVQNGVARALTTKKPEGSKKTPPKLQMAEKSPEILLKQRGKKKKKKKAILKLLLLGAVLKAKIGTLLQILSFKLQVKFFIIALIGLAINLARFWVELKHKHQQPQKVIYYEHAQHQHHYEHEEEPGWGPWSRSIIPEEKDEIDSDVSPYRAQERTQMFPTKPLLTLS
ncbi:uncharacterized protein LOC119836502 isoform X2 [Zerene cesonia]|uniref:uncharacterized protein LOC119836502 isoform X2 n=1 Tax=Zerene cesonia TaxID=33412 RepID=UPI0018E51E28|nr:uncharacterized protein LOC119836502 isoform X2 [Zerene cesonia]